MSRLAGLFVLATLATSVANAAPPFGTWKMNLQKSYFDPAKPASFRGFTLRFEPAENGMIRVTAIVEPLDGTAALTTSFLMRVDGKDYPVTNGVFDTVSNTPVDDATTIVVGKRNGKIVEKKRQLVYGTTMLQISVDTDNNVEIFDKQ